MEVLGYVFGMSALTFGLIGMVTATSAMKKVNELEGRMDALSPPDSRK